MEIVCVLMPFRALGAFGPYMAAAAYALVVVPSVLMPFRALGAFGRPDLAARFLFDDLCPHPLTRYFTQLQSFMSSLLFPKSGSHRYPSRHAANTPLLSPLLPGPCKRGCSQSPDVDVWAQMERDAEASLCRAPGAPIQSASPIANSRAYIVRIDRSATIRPGRFVNPDVGYGRSLDYPATPSPRLTDGTK